MVAITANVFGLGEGGLVGCSILAECVCPLLPNPKTLAVGIFSRMFNRSTKEKKEKKKRWH
jgi:hypothetical protein